MGTRSKGQDNTFSNAFWELYKSNAMPNKHMGVSGSHLRAVLIGLAAHANYSDGRGIRVGQTRVARETGLSVSTVKRAMAALLDLGWLVQTKEATYTSPAHHAIILIGSVHSERSPDRTESTPTGVTVNGESVHDERGEGSPRTGGSVHRDLLPINTNQYQSSTKDLSDLPQQRIDAPGDDDDQTLKVGVESSTNQEATPAPTVLDGNERMRNHTERIMSLMSDYETAHKGVYLIAKGCGYEFDKRQCCSIHEALAHRTFTADEMRTYMTEKLAAIGHLPQHAAPGILTGNASEWLTDYRRKKRDEEEGVQYLETTWGRMRVIPETEEEKRIKREIREQEERDRAAWLALSPEERKAKEEEFALMALRLFDFDAPRNKNQDHTTTEAQDQGEADTWT